MMSEYLTWRQLRTKLNQVSDDRALDEPALFAHLDAYGDETLAPVKLIFDTWHPTDEPNSLRYNKEADEYLRREFPAEDEDTRVLRQFPPNALLLYFSEMDEDHDERNAWLAKPNPHSLPKVPGPAPLFDATVIRCKQCAAILKTEFAMTQAFCSAECAFQASQSW